MLRNPGLNALPFGERVWEGSAGPYVAAVFSLWNWHNAEFNELIDGSLDDYRSSAKCLESVKVLRQFSITASCSPSRLSGLGASPHRGFPISCLSMQATKY